MYICIKVKVYIAHNENLCLKGMKSYTTLAKEYRGIKASLF